MHCQPEYGGVFSGISDLACRSGGSEDRQSFIFSSFLPSYNLTLATNSYNPVINNYTL